MSTVVDERGGSPRPADRRSRRGWWLVPELAALAVLAIVAVPFLGTSGPGQLRAEVARRAAQIVEQAAPTAPHDHGDGLPAFEQTFCGIDVFGTDPANANALAEVRVVYGYFFCAAGASGVPYTESNRADGPVVVTLTGTPHAQIAQSGAGYADRVRAIMPDQYEDRCFHGLPDASIAQAVRERYEDAI